MKTAIQNSTTALALAGLLSLPQTAAAAESLQEKLTQAMQSEQIQQLRTGIRATLVKTPAAAEPRHRRERSEPNGHGIDSVTLPFPQKRVSFSPR